ncbi:fasciclin domain-containing protein [Pedobacter arcticus]|uniref:fasciclin domain-containing protein n=1 Tax=Pedobacter arcticus TaxID=752140 RepID=UPI000361348A|nr:fasciclin domain-containing protein [Pedobacter arcticus]
MKKNKSINSTIIACTTLLLTLVFGGCNKDNSDVLPTISQTVVGLEDLSQLEFAAVKGDLVVALSNKNKTTGADGNFTIFAPTNQAFAKIGLVNPRDFNALQTPFLLNVLKYHVSNGNAKDDLLIGGFKVPSLLGPTVNKRIIIRGTDKYVNGSKIIVTNTQADNGIVHVINRVLLASGTDIANTALFFAQGKGFVQPELSFLAEALVYCDLFAALADANANYTVFAPTDQAFKDLGKTLGIEVNQPSDVRKIDYTTLKQILLNHVVSVGLFTSELHAGNLLGLSGKNITLGEYNDGLLTVKGNGNSVVANMVISDIQTTNGVVHVIDRVLLP